MPRQCILVNRCPPDTTGPPTFSHGRIVSVPTGQQGGETVHTVAAFSVRCSGTLGKKKSETETLQERRRNGYRFIAQPYLKYIIIYCTLCLGLHKCIKKYKKKKK